MIGVPHQTASDHRIDSGRNTLGAKSETARIRSNESAWAPQCSRRICAPPADRTTNLDLPWQYLRYFVDEKMKQKGDALSFDFDRDPATLDRAREI